MKRNREVAFEQWYQEQARQVLRERIQFYTSRHNFQYKKVGITLARARGGFCSVTGSLNFSCSLIMARTEIVDYVLVHEFVHIVGHDHSKRFRRKVAAIMPNYEEYRKWPREVGEDCSCNRSR